MQKPTSSATLLYGSYFGCFLELLPWKFGFLNSKGLSITADVPGLVF